MRKTMLMLALAACAVLASSSDAFAQRRGGGFGIGIGGGSGYGGYNRGYGFGNYGYGNGYYGNGFGNYGYGNGLYNSRYYGGYNSSPYYGGVYTQPYYGAPSYDFPPVAQNPGVNTYQSSYEPIQPQTARIMIMVPQPDATIWFNGAATTQQGMERVFATPPLEGNGPFSYTIRARWNENGKSVERERRINVQVGQTSNVDFRTDAGVN
jgi:uncharacterized protein (TIGR03000 family)